MAHLQRLENAIASWRYWQPALNHKPRIVAEIDGGLTNQSWLLETDQGKGVLRLNSCYDVEFNIDRYREKLILSAVANSGIAPPVWYCDPDMGILITAFIEGDVLTKSSRKNNQLGAEIKTLIKRIQNITLPLERFNYWQHLCHYEKILMREGTFIPEKLQRNKNEHEKKIQFFQESRWKMVLVHHDLNPSNIIKNAQGLYIIDWEYAAMGYAGMDWMAWSMEQDNDYPILTPLQNLINQYWLLVNQSTKKIQAKRA